MTSGHWGSLVVSGASWLGVGLLVPVPRGLVNGFNGGGRRGGWGAWVGVGLLGTVAVGVGDGFGRGGESEGVAGSGDGEPAAQVGRDECGSPVWALAVSPDGASLAAATIGGEV